MTFSWSAPRMSAPITSYNLSCSPSPSSLPRSFTLSGTYTLTGFYPETSYVCSLVAYNGLSAGPMTYVAFTTKEDCKLECLSGSCGSVVSALTLVLGSIPGQKTVFPFLLHHFQPVYVDHQNMTPTPSPLHITQCYVVPAH